jgi:hypothetical protein
MIQDKTTLKKEVMQGLKQYIDQTATNIVELAEIMNTSPAPLMDLLERAVQTKYHEGEKDDRDTK